MNDKLKQMAFDLHRELLHIEQQVDELDPMLKLAQIYNEAYTSKPVPNDIILHNKKK